MSATFRDTTTWKVQKLLNSIARRLPFQTLLETTGRKSGEPRTTPVGGRRIGNTYWLVSEFGDRSQYIRNIVVDPNVRLRLNGHWHRGTAHPLPGDDPRERMRTLPRYNNVGVRTFGTNLLTVRIDLSD